MMKKRDAVLIACVLIAALALMLVSRMMPKTDITQKTADVTLAPDAVEYLDETPSPTVEPTVEPTAVPAAEPTAEPAAEPTVEPTAVPTAEVTTAPTVEPTAEPAKASEQSSASAMVGPMPRPQTQEVKGHVILTVGGRQYGDPIPMDRDKIITIKQEDGKVNKVHITPDSVYMESSTCENQDCVGQGEVTLDNYTTRILSSFVICLPNEVTIELVPAD